MHTYRSLYENQWDVGYWRPATAGEYAEYQMEKKTPGKTTVWETLSSHTSEQDALNRVNFLNGGNNHEIWDPLTQGHLIGVAAEKAGR